MPQYANPDSKEANQLKAILMKDVRKQANVVCMICITFSLPINNSQIRIQY